MNQNKPRKNYDIKNFQNFDRPKKRKFDTPKPEGLQVYVREGEDVMKAWRKLKKKILRDGLMQEIKDRQYYQKPSEKKKIKKDQQTRRAQKERKEKAFEMGLTYKGMNPLKQPRRKKAKPTNRTRS